MIPAETMVFIVGVGRSGTSLLQAILSAHPNVYGLPETGVVRRYRLFDSRGAVQAEGDDYRLSRLGTDSTDARRAFEAAVTNGLSNADIVCDKDPRLIESLTLIERWLPGATIIRMQRNPVDIVASKRSADWSSGRSVLSAAVIGEIQWRLGKREIPELNLVQVSYESLVSSPTEEVERLCRSLGISPSSRMLEHWKYADGLVSKEESQWKQGILRPIGHVTGPKKLSRLETALVQVFSPSQIRDGAYSSNRLATVCRPAVSLLYRAGVTAFLFTRR